MNKKDIKNILATAKDLLKKENIKSYSLDAEILLSFILKKDKTFLFTKPDLEITERQKNKYFDLIRKRTKGEPVAYLLGQKDFFGLSFKVNKTVLIPRPETEGLVEFVLDFIKKQKDNFNLIDLGTGSGCIPVSILKSLSERDSQKIKKYIATDICRRAIKVAEFNFQKFDLSKKINYRQSDLLENITASELQNSIITANLPYVPDSWQEQNRTSETIGLTFEPTKALYAREDGLEYYFKLFIELRDKKTIPKILIGEIEDFQKVILEKKIKYFLPEVKIKFIRDLASKYRFFILEF
jgi:release factor glutamine methyltransferase